MNQELPKSPEAIKERLFMDYLKETFGITNVTPAHSENMKTPNTATSWLNREPKGTLNDQAAEALVKFNGDKFQAIKELRAQTPDLMLDCAKDAVYRVAERMASITELRPASDPLLFSEQVKLGEGLRIMTPEEVDAARKSAGFTELTKIQWKSLQPKPRKLPWILVGLLLLGLGAYHTLFMAAIKDRDAIIEVREEQMGELTEQLNLSTNRVIELEAFGAAYMENMKQAVEIIEELQQQKD